MQIIPLIDEKYLLREGDKLAVAIINVPLSGLFVETLRGFSKGVGIDADIGGCDFWEDVMEYDPNRTDRFDGIEFYSCLDDRVVLSFEDTYYYMRIASKNYIQLYPEDAAEVEELLAAYRKRFNIGEKG